MARRAVMSLAQPCQGVVQMVFTPLQRRGTGLCSESQMPGRKEKLFSGAMWLCPWASLGIVFKEVLLLVLDRCPLCVECDGIQGVRTVCRDKAVHFFIVYTLYKSNTPPTFLTFIWICIYSNLRHFWLSYSEKWVEYMRTKITLVFTFTPLKCL